MPIDLVSKLIEDVSVPGDFAEPSRLLAEISASNDPIALLQDWRTENGLFDAFHRDFPFMRAAKACGLDLEKSERLRWAAMFRWLIDKLRQWTPNTDAHMVRLTAILVAVQANDRDGTLWPALPTDVRQNVPLAARFTKLIGGFAMTFDAPADGPEPIWEREAVNELMAAEIACGWAAMGKAWRPFQDVTRPSTLYIQAVRFLFHRDVTQLAEASADVKQLAVAILVAQILDDRQRLLLGLASSNPFIQFASAYVTLNGRERLLKLPPLETRLFSQLLAHVAKDRDQWRGWMAVFNAFPSRYPALHQSLGLALVEAPESAVQAYVDSIILFPKRLGVDEGRRNVATCLRVFKSEASLDRRKRLWQLAHERWLAWDFDAANSHTQLLGMCWSEIDYAVVGFSMECLDEAERAQTLTDILTLLSTLEEGWHKSERDIKSAWFRLLSRLQPHAFAMILQSSPDDWLPEKQGYLPQIGHSEYLTLRYQPH